MIEGLFTKPIVIFGCGNILFGDDGFGPTVIEHLQSDFRLPDSVVAVDVGTSISDYLFDFLLAPVRRTHVFIVDATFQPHRRPGEIFELDIGKMSTKKMSDFSLHQFPSTNLLKELDQFAGVGVRILAVQAKEIPQAVRSGLSHEVAAAIPNACRWLLKQVNAVDEVISRDKQLHRYPSNLK